MKSLWITNAHLDHLSDTLEDAWFEKLAKTRADMLLFEKFGGRNPFPPFELRIGLTHPGPVDWAMGGGQS